VAGEAPNNRNRDSVVYMNKEPEFKTPYKAPLAEIPPSALYYADLNKRLRIFRHDLRKAQREHKPDNILQNIMHNIAKVEKAMLEHETK
jgi:hypothetical protein